MQKMAGLLTYFHPESLPDLSRISGKRCYQDVYKASQQRGLSGIYTRFPFNPPPERESGTDSAGKSNKKIKKIGIQGLIIWIVW